MKHILIALFFGIALLVAACDVTEEDAEGGTVTLNGQVLNAATNNPIAGALVRVLPFGLEYETDDEGKFSATVEVDSTMDLEVTASMDRFASSKATVIGVPGRSANVVLRLTQISEDPAVSGLAANILLKTQSDQSIGVKESGSQEVAQITFQVADSVGRPVVLDHAVDVNFSFGSRPGGGEFLNPSTVRTDNNGEVTVNLSSGTKAGVVQIVAQANVNGNIIRSLPVSVAIHGGLPDQAHFSLGPEKFNFPGLRKYGLTDPVSVIVGDKYANPVKPGTAVYFTSEHGVIAGSVLTNATGQGTVNYMSANPLPSNGVTSVTATTADENQNTVSARIPLLLSGLPVVQVQPTTASLNTQYTLKVTDQNGNPLAPGTKITVLVEGTKVKAVGHTDVSLDDTAFSDGARDSNGDGIADGAKDGDHFDYADVLTGPGITHFRFSAVPDMRIDESGEPQVESITVTVDGPNGSLELVLLKGAAPLVRTENAILESSNGQIVLRLTK